MDQEVHAISKVMAGLTIGEESPSTAVQGIIEGLEHVDLGGGGGAESSAVDGITEGLGNVNLREGRSPTLPAYLLFDPYTPPKTPQEAAERLAWGKHLDDETYRLAKEFPTANIAPYVLPIGPRNRPLGYQDDTQDNVSGAGDQPDTAQDVTESSAQSPSPVPGTWTKEEEHVLLILVEKSGGSGSANLWSRVHGDFAKRFPCGPKR